MCTRFILVALIGHALLLPPGMADEAQDDPWWIEDPPQNTAAINEGRLVFLEHPPRETVHHHYNRLIVSAESLIDGWVAMSQCHDHLDPVPAAQVVYNLGRIRNLKIESYRNIGKAWIEGHTVQLQDIQPHARLCIHAETRALIANDDGSYSLHSGPFMRRFLDGYYPMRVSMDVQHPLDKLRFVSITPSKQIGFHFWESTAGVHLDTWFEGKLNTEIRYEPVLCRNGDSTEC